MDGYRLKRSWGTHCHGRVYLALRLYNEVVTPFPDSLVILMAMLMILELRDRRTWNTERPTENVNSSQICPNLTHLETGLGGGKGRALQNCKMQFIFCLPTVSLLLFSPSPISLYVWDLAYVSLCFLLFIQRYPL